MIYQKFGKRVVQAPVNNKHHQEFVRNDKLCCNWLKQPQKLAEVNVLFSWL
jgi:hypothetical protein